MIQPACPLSPRVRSTARPPPPELVFSCDPVIPLPPGQIHGLAPGTTAGFWQRSGQLAHPLPRVGSRPAPRHRSWLSAGILPAPSRCVRSTAWPPAPPLAFGCDPASLPPPFPPGSDPRPAPPQPELTFGSDPASPPFPLGQIHWLAPGTTADLWQRSGQPIPSGSDPLPAPPPPPELAQPPANDLVYLMGPSYFCQ